MKKLCEKVRSRKVEMLADFATVLVIYWVSGSQATIVDGWEIGMFVEPVRRPETCASLIHQYQTVTEQARLAQVFELRLKSKFSYVLRAS